MRIEYRFAEFRADAITGERTLSGVAMPYGSLAQLRGFRERFEPRAFGDLSSADVTLNVQHDRGRVIARTGGRRPVAAGRIGGAGNPRETPGHARGRRRANPDSRWRSPGPVCGVCYS